jgi:molybdate transport system permease protein
MTPEEWTAVRLSLLVATMATLASLPFGIAIAWLLARRQFWGKSLLNGLRGTTRPWWCAGIRTMDGR